MRTLSYQVLSACERRSHRLNNNFSWLNPSWRPERGQEVRRAVGRARATAQINCVRSYKAIRLRDGLATPLGGLQRAPRTSASKSCKKKVANFLLYQFNAYLKCESSPMGAIISETPGGNGK